MSGTVIGIDGQPVKRPPPPPPPPDPPGIDKRSQYEDALADLLNKQGVEYDYESQAAILPGPDGPETIGTNDLADALLERLDVAAHGIPPERIARLIRLWRHDRDHDAIKLVRDNLRQVDAVKGRAEIRKLLDLICRDGHELSAVMLEQWVWLIRRRLYGLPTTSEVMLVMQGTSGSGKTKFAMHHLFKPLAPLVKSWTLNEITDERCFADFARCYVGYVEELAGAKKASLETLKAVITQNKIFARKLNTHVRSAIAQNCTFIGDTNAQICDVIRDETSGRRFWGILCKDEFDFEALSQIDYHAIFCCVDQGDKTPDGTKPPIQISGHYQRIKSLQARKIRAVDSIDEWIEEIDLAPGPSLITVPKLYAAYAKYCRENDLHCHNKDKLAKMLALRGLQRTRASIDGKQQRAFSLNQEF